MMIRGYKIRLYPTKAQEEIIHKHIGAARFIWNYMIAYQQRRFQNGEKHMSGFDMCNHLTIMKRENEYRWLSDVSNATLQSMCNELGKTYTDFFKKKCRYPKFKKKKKAKQIYPSRSDCVYFKNGFVTIQKVGKVKYKTDYDFSEGKTLRLINPRVSIDNGKYYLSFCLERENQVYETNGGMVGIDLGVKEFATVAYDDDVVIFHSINKSKRMKYIDNRINELQRELSRKLLIYKKRTGRYGLSNNAQKTIKKLRYYYRKASNIRRNYIHHVTKSLCGYMPDRIVVEDLDLIHLGDNVHMKKEVRDQMFFEFYRQMEYKTSWRQIEYVKADKYFPSSKTCSCCGYIKHDLKLRDRVFVCPSCGNTLDRDYNAALNLMKYIPSDNMV